MWKLSAIYLFALCLVFSSFSCLTKADTMMGSYPTYSASSVGSSDSFPVVDYTHNATKKILLDDLVNIPAIANSLALLSPLASPVFTGQVEIPSGSLSAPGIAFSAETNSGMYRVGADEWAVVADGIAGLDILSNGTYTNIGMGGPASSSSAVPFFISRTYSGQLFGQINNPSTSAGSLAYWSVQSDAGNNNLQLMSIPSATASPYMYSGGGGYIIFNGSGTSTDLVLATNVASGKIRFSTGGYASTNEIAYINSAGLTMENGSIIVKTTGSKTATYAIASIDQVITYDASGGSFTTTLPTAASVAGKTFNLIYVGAVSSNFLTIATTSSQTIGTLGTSVHMSTPNESWSLISDGSNWQILSHQTATDWTTFSMTIKGETSNPTRGTVATENAWWRRIGRNIEVRYEFNMTGSGSAGSGSYVFLLPNSWTLNGSLVSFLPGNAYQSLGGGDVYNSGSGVSVIYVQTSNVLNNGFTLAFGVSALRVGSGSYSFGGAVQLGFLASAPVTNWEP